MAARRPRALPPTLPAALVLSSLLGLAACGSDAEQAAPAPADSPTPLTASPTTPSPSTTTGRVARRVERLADRRTAVYRVGDGHRFTAEPPPSAEPAENPGDDPDDDTDDDPGNDTGAAGGTTTAAGNPLAGRPWGTYLGPAEQVAAPYAASSGATRSVLSYIAQAPKAAWFGAWIPDAEIEARTRAYVAAAQAGNPETLVQLTDFRAVPWEGEACRRLPTPAEQASYRRWTDGFARGIGSAHAAVVLQPDGPFALCAPGGVGVQTALVRYAAERLSALPNTAVYIEVGSSDWPAPGQGGVPQVLRFLLPAGIESARGIALNGTHYASTEEEVRRGADVVRALEARGITGKKVVVNTSSNGQPFRYGQYRGSGRWAHPDNARPCASTADPGTCVALGIPPTADVTNPRWGLSAEASSLAAAYVDGYLWFGRPWLHFQNSPFELDKALAVTRSSPYWGP